LVEMSVQRLLDAEMPGAEWGGTPPATKEWPAEVTPRHPIATEAVASQFAWSAVLSARFRWR